MSEPVVQASADRVPDLAALLGRAFTDDPMLVWPFGDDRTDLITEFFRAFDEQIAGLGWLWETGPGLGVAAWIPPGSDQVMMDIDRSMRSTLAAAEARHEEMWEWIADNFPREPFWYLDHLAVDIGPSGDRPRSRADPARTGLRRSRRRPGFPRDGTAGERRVLRAAGLPDDRGRRRAGRRPAPLVHALRPLSRPRAEQPVAAGTAVAGIRPGQPRRSLGRRLEDQRRPNLEFLVRRVGVDEGPAARPDGRRAIEHSARRGHRRSIQFDRELHFKHCADVSRRVDLLSQLACEPGPKFANHREWLHAATVAQARAVNHVDRQVPSTP